MTAEEVLAGAADLMEERGWCRGKWEEPTGEVCLQSAILRNVSPEDSIAAGEAWDAVMRETAPHYPLTFNDRFCSSKEEAVAILRNAKRWL